jgi:hypothetical protein
MIRFRARLGESDKQEHPLQVAASGLLKTACVLVTEDVDARIAVINNLALPVVGWSA